MSADNEKIVVPDEFKLSTSINNLSLTRSSDISTCDNCGKEGSNINNICNKCKSATYCNAACKKKHRHKHKEDCEKRVAELQEEQVERERRAAELHDEKLFKQPPPPEDCPICMLTLPTLNTGYKYKMCCGKLICSGCTHAVGKRDGGVGLCPFCRTPTPASEELLKQIRKRIEAGDAHAMYDLGCFYFNGLHGLPQDYAKALELWHRAAELGNALAYHNIGSAYYEGNGVERDEKKALHYWELAAMGGDTNARHNLGAIEFNTGNMDLGVLEKRAENMDRALKHHMIAAGSGYSRSLENIKLMYKDGYATKDDYAKALRVYQANPIEIKSPQRDEAAAFSDNYKYY